LRNDRHADANLANGRRAHRGDATALINEGIAAYISGSRSVDHVERSDRGRPVRGMLRDRVSGQGISTGIMKMQTAWLAGWALRGRIDDLVIDRIDPWRGTSGGRRGPIHCKRQ